MTEENQPDNTKKLTTAFCFAVAAVAQGGFAAFIAHSHVGNSYLVGFLTTSFLGSSVIAITEYINYKFDEMKDLITQQRSSPPPP